MRSIVVIGVRVIGGLPALGQNPSAERRDQVLNAWEKRASGIESFTAKVSRDKTDSLTRKVTRYVGDVAFKNPNLWKIDLVHQDEASKKDSEKTTLERIYCDGKWVYEFVQSDKLVNIHTMPKGDTAQSNIMLDLLKGMKSEDVKKRFDVAWSRNETEWYAFIKLTPKNDLDKRELDEAEVAICMKNPNSELVGVPFQFTYRQRGGQVTFNLSKPQANPKLDEKSFTPRLIEGYKIKMASTSIPPQTP